MTCYTFHSLSDTDFEDVVGDLLSQSLGIPMQRFAKGRDLGIDLLAGPNIQGSLVVQCKHFVRSGYRALLSSLRKELPKIQSIAPSRYIVATSVSLTPPQTQAIADLLQPYCSGIHDVYGADRVNALLREYPDVEKTHHKLWLTSTRVLEHILNHGLEAWDYLERSAIERQLSLYVQTEAFDQAIKILQEYNYCIISGIPGIGKTTLARVLVAQLMDNGYSPVFARDDISQAYQQINFKKPQVVLYDDFLGRSSLQDRLGKNEDKGIAQLLRQAAQSKVLKVLFTTREYLLTDALHRHEGLPDKAINLGKCVLDIGSYTRPKRARMLYNHMYFSNLPRACIEAFVREKHYNKAIDHANFSPRLIEWVTTDGGAIAATPECYAAAFFAALDRPERIWQPAFDNQLDPESRSLLFSLASFGRLVDVGVLESAWQSYWIGSHGRGDGDVRSRFLRALKTLESSFIAIFHDVHARAIDWANPSIRDFVLQRIAGDEALRRSLLSCATHFDQVTTLLRAGADGRLAPLPIQSCIRAPEAMAAISRTLLSERGTVTIIKYESGSKQLKREPVDVGTRLSDIIRWYGIDDFSGYCPLDLFKVALGSDRMISTGACAALDVIYESYSELPTEWERVVIDVMSTVRGAVSDSTDADEWMEWAKFVNKWQTRFPGEWYDQDRQAAIAFCEAEAGADWFPKTSSQVKALIDWIEDFGSIWGFETRELLETLNEECSELEEAEEHAADLWEDEWKMNRDSERGSYSDVDDLFESLLNRDNS